MKSMLARIVLAAALMAGVDDGATLAGATLTERVIVDPHSGIALYGIDPVGYFTDGRPLVGRADFEYSYSGAVWRFRNEGNRAAFTDHPDVYMPSYGGYDPVSLARGATVPGHPALWAMVQSRVYLFANAAARDAFLGDPQGTISSASAKWPQVRRTLLP
jgi:YHS domain-containing protein